MRLLWCCLAAGLGFAGCKKTVEPPPAPQAPAAQAPAVPEKPAPGAPAQVVATSTSTAAPVTLSVFEPKGEGCEWRRLNPLAQTSVVVASFPGPCRGARWAFNSGYSQALVWFDPHTYQQAGYYSQSASPQAYPDESEDDAPKERLYSVRLKDGVVQAVRLPQLRGQLRELGLDPQGRILALSDEPIDEAVAASGRVMVDGSTVSIPAFDEGVPGLVHGYRFDEQKWQRAESKVVSTGWDYGQGVEALDLHAQLGPVSAALLGAHADGDSASPAEQQALRAFRPAKASEEDGEWLRLKIGPPPAFVWQVSGEFVYNTGLIVFGGPSLARAAEVGFTDGELVAVATQGPYLLVSSQIAGTHPRLYDATQRRLLFKSDTARGATFWPVPKEPEAARTGATH